MPEYTIVQKDYAQYRLDKSKEDTQEQITNAEYVYKAVRAYVGKMIGTIDVKKE